MDADPATSKRVEETVLKTVSAVTGKDVRQITLKSPLTGTSAPSFVQRIEIVRRLESEFGLKIPDEHWNYLNTVGELVDYVQKRQLLSQKVQAAPIQPSIPTTNIPSGVQQRPIFKR
jgi:acyl carrier protein